jgi:hypothetical protein
MENNKDTEILEFELRGEIIRAPNTTKKFNELLFVFFIGKEGLPVWWLFRNIRIHSPDTDIFFILLHYALELQGVTILFDTGTRNKKRLIDITKLAKIIHTGDLFTAIQQAGKNLHLQKQIL